MIYEIKINYRYRMYFVIGFILLGFFFAMFNFGMISTFCFGLGLGIGLFSIEELKKENKK